jgi:hypothetical protein
MKVFLAVLVDLWEFILELLIPVKKIPPQSFVAPLLLAPQHNTDLLMSIDRSVPSQHSFVKSAESISPTMISALPVGYIAVAKTGVMAKPLWAFDTQLNEYTYGEKVSILGYEGRFVHILYQTESAWILKDAITTNRADIYPTFASNNIYLAADSETKKLRQVILDEFFTSELYLPLQSVEFVYYKLKELNINIPWGKERPRLAGQWHDLLKGHLGVKIGIFPKTGSILEGKLANDVGFLGYVTAVYPGDGISLQSVGKEVEGKYLEEKLSKEEWQALQAVFIQIS